MRKEERKEKWRELEGGRGEREGEKRTDAGFMLLSDFHQTPFGSPYLSRLQVKEVKDLKCHSDLNSDLFGLIRTFILSLP